MMKILFFSPYFFPYVSGLSLLPYRILTHLSKDFCITVLTFPHEEHLKKKEYLSGLKVLRMPYLFRISKGYISSQSIFFFIKETFRNDLIFINLPSVEGIFLVFFGFFMRKKIVAQYICDVKLQGSFFERLIEHFLRISTYIQLALSDKIITNKDYILGLPFPDYFKNKCIYSYPPITHFVPDKKEFTKMMKRKKTQKWVGYIGRIAREKGLTFLIQALVILKEEIKNIVLVFGGPNPENTAGEKKYFHAVVKQLKQYHIPHLFYHDLSRGQLGALYKSLDLLALPSTNRTEAFGMVQVEAMLAGRPVVASNLPGVRVPVQKTKMGLLVPPKNATKLAEAIKKILINQAIYTQKSSIEKAKKMFDEKNVFQTYKTIFDPYQK